MTFTVEERKQIRSLLWERMKLCQCGSPEQTFQIVKELLERAEDHKANGSFYADAHDANGRWVEFAAKVIDSWDLTEHGTGIGYAWLTVSGKLLLGFLREYGTDPDEESWPEWANTFQCVGVDGKAFDPAEL